MSFGGPSETRLSRVFRETFLHRCGPEQGEKVRAFGTVIHSVGNHRYTGSPTWAATEYAAAVRELRQALGAMELCARNRDRTNALYRPILGHVLYRWREHYRRHLAPLLTVQREES